MTETLNDKIKKLVAKYNSIQGSLLSMGKRLTALEEKETHLPEPALKDNELLTKVATYLGFIKDEKETDIIEETAEVIEESEEIAQETIDALDEVIEDG